MFKLFIQNESDIPADHKAFYEQRDGGWWLKVEGAVPKEKLDEFRNTNNDLKTKLGEATAKLKPYEDAGVDLTKWTELKGKERDLAEGALYKKGELDTIIADRTKSVKEEHERAMKALKDASDATARDLAAAQARESKLVIDNGLIAATRKLQLRPGSEDVVMALAAPVWKMVDGKPVCFGPDGKPAYSGKTGLDKTMDEWAQELATTKPFLFVENKGSGNEPGFSGTGGSGGGGSGAGSGQQGNPGYNPWMDKTWNMTEQMKLTGKNPQEAKRLCEAAGKKWTPPGSPTGKPAPAMV